MPIIAVVGNKGGAGKTTLFRMLTGQETPDEGTIEYGDTVETYQQRIDVNGPIRGVVDLLRSDALRHYTTIKLDLGDELPHRFVKVEKKGLFGRLFGG